MIQLVNYRARFTLQHLEIYTQTGLVQFTGGYRHFDFPVMAMQVFAVPLIIHQVMSSSKTGYCNVTPVTEAVIPGTGFPLTSITLPGILSRTKFTADRAVPLASCSVTVATSPAVVTPAGREFAIIITNFPGIVPAAGVYVTAGNMVLPAKVPDGLTTPSATTPLTMAGAAFDGRVRVNPAPIMALPPVSPFKLTLSVTVV